MKNRAALYLVNVTHVSVKVGILDQLPPGALEQDIVGEIEPDESGEEADIGQRQLVSAEVAKSAQMILQLV